MISREHPARFVRRRRRAPGSACSRDTWTSSNHYFLSIRSSNQLQIRKIVNGVTTVLEAVSFTAAPGVMHEYTFSVVGNELHAFVDGQLVATALDDALPRGKYGMGTYRAAATWQDFSVDQP